MSFLIPFDNLTHSRCQSDACHSQRCASSIRRTSSTGVPCSISGPFEPIIFAVFAASSLTCGSGCVSKFLDLPAVGGSFESAKFLHNGDILVVHSLHHTDTGAFGRNAIARGINRKYNRGGMISGCCNDL